MNQTYEKLLQLPLFLGMSQSEVTDLVGYTKLGFHKCAPGERVVTNGEACRSLIFLLSGEVTVEHHAANGSYSINERLSAPALLECERLFGLYQHFSRSYTAATECRLMTIQKQAVMSICHHHPIFLMNLLGLLSTASQRAADALWQQKATGAEQRIISFLRQRILTPHGEKTVRVKMTALGKLVHESRLTISQVLNEWSTAGLVSLTRGSFTIPDFQRLLTPNS